MLINGVSIDDETFKDAYFHYVERLYRFKASESFRINGYVAMFGFGEICYLCGLKY